MDNQEPKRNIKSVKVWNLTVPEVPEEQTKLDINHNQYSRFGSDNLFPQALIHLARNSSVHRGIINNKTTYVVGDGVSADDDKTYNYLQEVNAEETIDEVMRKLVLDWHVFGNAYLELVTDGKRSFMLMFHKDASKWRYSKDRKTLLYHPDWSKHTQYKRHTLEYPIFPQFKRVTGQKYMRSILHLKQYEPGSEIYGIPQYIAGMNAAGIIYKTDKWNLSRLDNSFKPSGVLIVDGIESDDDAESLNEEFKEYFTGEGNSGKVMTVFKNLGGEGTQFVNFNDSYEGDWTSLHTQSEGNIITAHNWYRSLAGIADNTGFDTKRILQEYEVAKNTVIRDTQNFFLGKIEKVLRMRGLSGELQIVNRPPATIAGLLDANAVTKVWEAREMLGLEYDETDPEQQKYVKQGASNGNTSN